MQHSRKKEGPVTIIIRRTIKPGHEAEFESWLKGIGKDAQEFEGYLGVNILKPSGKHNLEYVNIFRFDSYENMCKWESSDIRNHWLEKLDQIVTNETKPQIVTGLEFWFTLPDKPFEKPPPRYKMALLTWMAIFPILFILPPAVRALMQGLPDAATIAVVSVLMVVLMTYGIMPMITRVFAKWLFR